ncbi:MAG TPA: TerB family tellurite resistance protein, partial [Flavisolibacter sp.]|nr:TerB family tellurite resistance protein [Flavisolibacter sp.]
MDENNSILEGHTDIEKTAYLGAIASIATADRQATEDELAYISGLCNAAGLNPDQSATVQNAATDISGNALTNNLEVLKNSNLKYSLVADLMTFAKSDTNYSEEED